MERTKYGVLAVSGALVAVAAAGVFGETLTVNGKSSPISVRTIEGSAYVKLADVAKALDMVVVKRPGGYEFSKAGGANQVGTLQGKVGDTLFDGKWRFTVLGVETPESYAMTTDAEPYDFAGRTSMDSRTRVIKPAKGYSLVVIRCRVANGVKERRTLWTAPSDKRLNTAIADSAGGSHPPVAYDFKGGSTQSEWLLPGAQLTFAVVFSIPDGVTAQDLVFSLKNNQTDDKPVDVRVSLAK